jgi:hypothetical protein
MKQNTQNEVLFDIPGPVDHILIFSTSTTSTSFSKIMSDVVLLLPNTDRRALREHMNSLTVFGGSVLLIFLVYALYFFCLRLVSCVPNLTSASGLSILDCLFL